MKKLRAAQAAIAEGTRVMYSAGFLRSTGQVAGEAPFRKGTVTSVAKDPDFRLARVRWDDGHESGVLVANLWPEGKRHLEPT
jgi:hypothetical protein